ncbi:hypothetical protein BDF22DRAFT_739517 [Syncephalis plumigaleata]|nr:hypothetical protein BDF22DRAFT_739517 [Syncephalis plumigaleata]
MVYHSPIPDIHIPEQNIYHVLFEEKPINPTTDDKPLFIDGTTGIGHTFSGLRQLTKRFAGALQSTFNAKRGQVLALYSPNSIDYPVVTFGALAAGLAVTTANAAYTANELAFQLKDSSASFLVADYEALDTAVEAANKVGIPRQHIIVTGIIDESARARRHQGYHTVYSFLGTSSEVEPVSLTAHDANHQTAYLCYSSGTTGNPKGVELTHKNILANIFQFSAFENEHWSRLPSNDVVAGFLPFYHIYGLTVLVHISIHRRAPVVVMRRFQFDTFLQHIERYKITIAYVAPPVCLALAKDPLVDKHDISSLREVISGAAPLGAELAATVRLRLNTIIRQASGMSETSPIIVAQPANRVADGSVGKLLPNIIAKVIDENGNEVSGNGTGELCVKGPNIMKGYLNNPEATRNMIDADGFLHTGDVVQVDEIGDFYIVDRIKELIKYKGYQVPPAELEAILQTHEAIADAAVIPVVSEELATELPKAYVALKATHIGSITASEVADYVAKRVAPHKQLRGGVEFLDVVPRSPSGKILRKLLRSQANDEKKVSAKL